MRNIYFFEYLTRERLNERRQLADEMRRAALAEHAELKRGQASPSCFSFLFQLLSPGRVPDLRPSALSERAEDRRDR
jgi:hypothetical protein